mmetsp:Transcript_20552/g.58421  ORF Transcript_20552/g.58421 Transcript_20552/m.58421 type:complete len:204 (-) Transcript_20552:115-726(-)
MGLDRDVFGGEFLSADDDLVDWVLGLGDGLGLQEALEVAGGPGWDVVQSIKLDDVVDGPLVSRPQRLSDELGKTSVERVLPSLETGAGWSAATGLLSSHSEAAGGSLSGGDTATLSLLAVSGTWRRSQVVKGELEVVEVVDVALVGLPSLPVENLHGELAGGARHGCQRAAARDECVSICRRDERREKKKAGNERLHGASLTG